MVLPRKLLHDDPWLRSYLVRVFEDAGLDWRTHIVGPCNRINPATALAEFDAGRDEVSDFDGGIDSGGFNEPESGYHPDQDIRDDNSPDRTVGSSGRINPASNAGFKSGLAGITPSVGSSTQSGAFRSTVKRNSGLTQKNVGHVRKLQNLVGDASAVRSLGRYDERDLGHVPNVPGMRNSSFGGKTVRNALYSDDYGFTPNDLPSSADNPYKPEYLGGSIRVPGVPGRRNSSFNNPRDEKGSDKWSDTRTPVEELNRRFPNKGPGERFSF